MSYSVFYPILALFLGLAFSKTGWPFLERVRSYGAFILMRFCIPFLTFYNIAYATVDTFYILLGMILVMVTMLQLALRYTADPLKSLCFFYLNLELFGLPVVLSFYGPQEAKVLMAACIGSTLFGNAIGPRLLQGDTHISHILPKIWRSPTAICVALGLVCLPFRQHLFPAFFYFQEIAKVSLNLVGMFLLGLWIGQVRLCIKDLCFGIRISLLRAAIFSVLITFLILYGEWVGASLIIHNKAALYLIGLLPGAPNILVMESHLLKTGRSAPLILGDTLISLLFIGLYILVGAYLL